MIDQEQLVRISGAGKDKPTSDIFVHKPIEVRALFISDVHLGSEACEADDLVNVLNHIKPQYLYIVGDFADKVRNLLDFINSIVKFLQKQVDVIQKILRHARKGTIVVYVPGNHDVLLRPKKSSFPYLSQEAIDLYCAFRDGAHEKTGHWPSPARLVAACAHRLMRFGNIHVVSEIIHKTLDGRSILLRHGDEFDPRYYQPVGYAVGSLVRDALCAASLKKQVQDHRSELNKKLPENATNFLRAHNQITGRRRLQGYLGGHNHMPALMTTRDGLFYGNCGDWVGSKSAIVEHLDGRFELITWDKDHGIVAHPNDPNRKALIVSHASVRIAAE